MPPRGVTVAAWLGCIAASVVAPGTTANDGARSNYLLHCGGCHLSDGRGVPPDMPSLRAIGPLAGIPDGRRYLARVPGAAHAPLGDAELAAVLNWVLRELGEASLPQDFVPLTPSEVGAARRDVLLDPLRERQRIWSAYDLGDR